MALCFVHGAAVYLSYEAVRKEGPPRLLLLAGAVILANGPDLDFLPGLLAGQPGLYHRTVSHTAVAAVAVGLVVGMACRLFGWRGRAALWAALWAGATYATHLLLDFFTADVKPPSGEQLLWPLSDRYFISPVTPLREVMIDGSGRLAFLASLVTPPALAVWAGEIVLLVLVVAAVRLVRLARAGVTDACEVRVGSEVRDAREVRVGCEVSDSYEVPEEP